MRREAEIATGSIVAAIDKFDDPSLTDSALRTLVHIGVRTLDEAISARDWVKAQESAYAVLQTCAILERRASAQRE
jgi:hypothetical protein